MEQHPDAPPSLGSVSAQVRDLQHQSTTLIVLSVVNGMMNVATIAIAYLLANP